MANLIIGHSQVKYFENYLSVMNTKCEYYSGCLIEDLLKESSVKKLIPESQVIFINLYLSIYLSLLAQVYGSV